jgi:uncharacterized protein YegP (UPF0339 family)
MPTKKKEPLPVGFSEFVDGRGKHRGRLVMANHEIVFSSSQGFASKQKMVENARLVAEELGAAIEQWVEQNNA